MMFARKGSIVREMLNRRRWMGRGGTLAAGMAAGWSRVAQVLAEGIPRARTADEPFGYCLNTSTIQGQSLTLAAEIDLAVEVGYDGIEPWVRELDQHAKAGQSLADLGKRASDRGLAVEDVIGFFEWAVDDDARRARGLEEARRSMSLVKEIGGKRIAAPPFGATDRGGLDLRRVAERYRVLAEIGAGIGVTPIVEVWGFSSNLTQLGG